MSRATNYQINCAPCHTSQLASQTGSEKDMVFREASVNCEMCHGPSGRHVAALKEGKPYAKRAIDPPVDFSGIDHREYVAICAQCHMQSATREQGHHGEWDYAEDGDSFVCRYNRRPLAEFSGRAFYKDGRLRETTFIAEALMRTACYRRGQVHCGHCHDPHPADAAENPTSLKFRGQPDQMCLQCHANYGARVEEHSHHRASSEGSRCVNCHMPRIMNSVLFVARTHRIDDKPRAEDTLRFGQKDSPNACLLCHGEKDAQWVARQLQSWGS
jgi:predicted CXXCH cytochrome family protein